MSVYLCGSHGTKKGRREERNLTYIVRRTKGGLSGRKDMGQITWERTMGKGDN